MNSKSLLLLAFAVACTASPIENTSSTDPSGDLRYYYQVASVVISPDPVSLAFNQIQQFNARVTLRSGYVQNNPSSLSWTAIGGTVGTKGQYTAGSASGVFWVRATANNGVRDSAVVMIGGGGMPPTTVRVTVTPDAATIQTGARLQFTASAKLSDSSTVTPALNWTASLGSISSSGLFTAPASAGVATVIGASANGKADTSQVTVTTSSPPPPTISTITVTPASASLTSGATQQFTANATLSDGTSQTNPSVSWTATGGGITSAGLYTAGGTAGGYRVIATGSGHADTSDVTISVTAPPPPPGARTYSTSFPLTESPIREGGNWVNGFVNGLDWSDVATKPGMAYGPQRAGSYNDPTALLEGTWGPNQRVTAVIAGTANDACGEEVELRLRSAISAHSNRGYEVTFKNSTDPGSTYLIIVRWNGALGNFTYLFDQRGDPKFFIQPGDVISATIVSNLIAVYKNGTLVGQVTDNTFTTGQPGIGFSFDTSAPGCSSVGSQFGFSSVTATDAP